MKIVRLLLLTGCGFLTATCGWAADVRQQLETLKAQFPEMKVQTVEAAGRGELHSHQSVEVKVPPADVWAKYHGPVASATPATLPAVLAQLEASKKADSRMLQNHQKTIVGAAARAQAEATALWLGGPLTAYLGKLKALVPPAK